MKLDVTNKDFEEFEELPSKQKLVKKKTKDFLIDKTAKSKKSNSKKKDFNEDI
tara:strand:+ start:686 stop:844 length:159 start_codon:yes stop_codon:yes gene_type:complete